MVSEPRPLSVLVVDDEPVIRSLLADILDLVGHRAVVCATGDDAIRALAGAPGAVDVAIVDLMMPGKDGLETLRALRSVRPDLPAVISTGAERTLAPEGTSLEELSVRESFEILEKPYKIDSLASALERATGRPS